MAINFPPGAPENSPFEAPNGVTYTWNPAGYWEAESGGSGGGGGDYVLPIASDAILGGIKVGTNLSIDNGGVLSSSAGGSTYGDSDVEALLGAYDFHIIPGTNATYDIGNAEKKVRHLFLSDNSLRFVDSGDNEYPLSVSPGPVLMFNGEPLAMKSEIPTIPSTPNLQAVTDIGSVTTNDITAPHYKSATGMQVTALTGIAIEAGASQVVQVDSDVVANGAVEVGGGYADGNGTKLFDDGRIYVRGDGLGDNVGAYQIYRGGNAQDNITARIDFDGSASFAGRADIGTNSLSDYGAIFANNSDTQATIVATNAGAGETILSQADSDQIAFKVNDIQTNTSETVIIYGNGSADFVGNITSGDFEPFSGTGAQTGVGIFSAGVINVVRTGGSGERAFEVYNPGVADPTMQLMANGDADFVGNVKSQNAFQVFHDDAQLASLTWQGDDTDNNAYLHLSHNGTGGGYPVLRVNEDGNPSFEIHGDGTLNSDGSASFSGSVVSVENTLVSATAPDFTEGNMWVVAEGVQVFSPVDNTTAPPAMSGVFRLTGAPLVWGTSYKFPGGTAPTINAFPAIIPFYIQDSNHILCGTPVEGIA